MGDRKDSWRLVDGEKVCVEGVGDKILCSNRVEEEESKVKITSHYMD